MRALVTNATDFAGPPAVAALQAAGFEVLAHDRAFAGEDARAVFLADHPQAVLLGYGEPEALVEAAWAAGPVDVLVSNDHHPAITGPIETLALSDLGATLDGLVVRPFRLLQAAVPRLKAQGSGRVIAIASCRMALPVPGGSIPDAARAGQAALVRSLAVELAPFGIPVNAIAPNYLASEAYYPKAVFVDDPAGRAFVEQVVPAGRLGRPDEIGELIRFLATTTSTFLTGSTVDFAGAWPASPPLPKRP